MKPCSRRWQAEARIDGRLDEADAASFEQHVSRCAECAAEQEALRALHARFAGLDAPRPSELKQRAQRAELLKRAHEQSKRSSPARAWALVAVAACAAGVGVAFAWPKRAPNAYDVVDVAQARWHATTEGGTSRVTLEAGTALFQVQRLRPDARFLVRLPDGEIEVRGTRFVVDVSPTHTRSVVVTEGKVVLRIGGAEELLLAGDRWPREAPAGAASAPLGTWVAPQVPTGSPAEAPDGRAAPSERGADGAREEPAAPPSGAGGSTTAVRPTQGAASAIPAGSASPAAAASVAEPPPTTAPSAASSAPPPDAPTPGARFAEAMSAFTRGDYGRADHLFAEFTRDFPRDGRTEDASYLRIECRARVGDRGGAAARARQYLQAFPRGLRRPEAERFIPAQ